MNKKKQLIKLTALLLLISSLLTSCSLFGGNSSCASTPRVFPCHYDYYHDPDDSELYIYVEAFYSTFGYNCTIDVYFRSSAGEEVFITRLLPKAKPAHFDRYLNTEGYHTPFPVPESMFCEEEGFFDIFAKAYEYPKVPGEDSPITRCVQDVFYKTRDGSVKIECGGAYFYPYDLLI